MTASTVTPFNFNNQDIRVILRDGNPWFVAKDVCDTLGYVNNRDALAKHLDDDEKGVANSDTLGGMQKLTIINESGLYALVLRSRKPEARKFSKWVTSEVLPAIRKTGTYTAPYSVQPGQTLSAEQADTLRNALNAHALKMPPNEQGRFLREGWSKLKAHFKTDYRHIPANQFTDAMSIVARHCEGNTPKPAGPLSTPEQLIEAWFAPNGYHFDTEFLHRLAITCHERIFTAYQFQRSRASGQPVNVQWANGLSGEMTH